jgi:hypothetical protein
MINEQDVTEEIFILRSEKRKGLILVREDPNQKDTYIPLTNEEVKRVIKTTEKCPTIIKGNVRLQKPKKPIPVLRRKNNKKIKKSELIELKELTPEQEAEERNKELLRDALILAKKKKYREMHTTLSEITIGELSNSYRKKLCNRIWVELRKNKKIQGDMQLFKDFALLSRHLDSETADKQLSNFGKEKRGNT